MVKRLHLCYSIMGRPRHFIDHQAFRGEFKNFVRILLPAVLSTCFTLDMRPIANL